MAQRQFRSDDSSTWVERYGAGGDGVLTVSADATDSTATTSVSVSTGSTAATFGSFTGFADGNLILIHQSRNGGDGAGNWELNKIASHSGTNITLSYNTTHAYDTTAQVYLLKQYSTVTINSGKTITGTDWAGTTGGIVAYLANTSITVTGNIVVKGATGGARGSSGTNAAIGGAIGGFRGGDLVNATQSNTGEGTTGRGNTGTTAANGNGGGGGFYNGSGGGGGGNGSNGTAGDNGRSDPASTGGTVGATAGNAGLTLMVFGGGGGGGNGGAGGADRAGSSGGGIIFLMAPTITVSGTVNTDGGTDGGEGNYEGGAGSGGSVLIKGNALTLGSAIVTANRGTSFLSHSGYGRVHADYGASISGTSNPTIDSRQDALMTGPLAGSGSTFLLNFI